MTTIKREKIAFQQRGQAFLLATGKELALEHLPSEKDLRTALEKKLCVRLTLQTGEAIYARVVKVIFIADDAYLSGEIVNEREAVGIVFQAVFYYSEKSGWIKL